MKTTSLLVGGVFFSCYIFGIGILFERLQSRIVTCGGIAEQLQALKARENHGKKLAIVVPVHEGDVNRALVSLTRWPSACARSTLHYTDLVVYHAEDLDESEEKFRVPEEASRCFRAVKVVSAKLTPEENVYPIGPSAQFYKMFLEPSVRKHFTEYDALAIIEWDVVIAHDSSFQRLYEAAFSTSEPFWMKGSTLVGTEFHDTSALSDMWHVLGHLNGNAIYNNTDPFFVEYINYTFSRWEYSYPYDVALWATISDFPYSWTLWQRYSSKFVSTNLISNVGFFDVSDKVVDIAIAADTLLIHGSTSSVGRMWNTGTSHRTELGFYSEGCTDACGWQDNPTSIGGVSSVCDATCLREDAQASSRFHGYGCGAGDPAKYGEGCRLCYHYVSDALAAEQALASEDTSTAWSDVHVIMCNTKHPPQSTTCSRACDDNRDTICDSRCGSGHYHDLNCNWRGLGEFCRFCFHDIVAARLADEMAGPRGERVIMCDTHEPPQLANTYDVDYDASNTNFQPKMPGVKNDFTHRAIRERPVAEFPGNLTRANICAFIPGHLEFFAETNLSVYSVLEFMPEMKVVIATNPMDFHVFNRTLGRDAVVSVVNASYVQYAALTADLACGEDTRIIYYLSPGQVLSRPFSGKDTHSPKGDLLVTYADADDVGNENAGRAMFASFLLGFHSPSFTFGADLILPADTNAELRAVLNKAARATELHEVPSRDGTDITGGNLYEIHTFLSSVMDRFHMGASIHIPEVLAALSFKRNPDGISFYDLKQWSHDHLFKETSIWEIPLVKPRFSCTMDLALSLAGYDVAAELRERVTAFGHGARCDEGFIAIEPESLKTKADWEFGAQGSIQAIMPALKDYRISVMYRTFCGDLDLFEISLPTVIDRFREALEVVVVVEEDDEELFDKVLDRYRPSSPFPLRIVTEPSLMDGHIQQKYSKMRADLYTEGDYILHLDSDVVLFEEVTYDHIFHLGKPVLPFRRYRDETPDGNALRWCWQNGTSFAIGEDVVHEFSIFNTHVYPRSMYPALRDFIKKRHGSSFAGFMHSRRGKCMHPNTLAKWTQEERTLLLSDFNLMGAFLWYHMHDTVHWMATDPLDIRPDEWRRDVTRYAWVCQANGRRYPSDPAGQELYKANYLAVKSAEHCRIVSKLWRDSKMLVPATRTYLDTAAWK